MGAKFYKYPKIRCSTPCLASFSLAQRSQPSLSHKRTIASLIYRSSWNSVSSWRDQEKRSGHTSCSGSTEDQGWQLQSFPLRTQLVFCAEQIQRDPSFGAGNRWVGLAKLPWGVCIMGFQVRVHGVWGIMCLLSVPEDPTHSLRQWSIRAALCFSVCSLRSQRSMEAWQDSLS